MEKYRALPSLLSTKDMQLYHRHKREYYNRL
nr:MAG TPA: hypothetical protein [Caudoviricetes sp.]